MFDYQRALGMVNPFGIYAATLEGPNGFQSFQVRQAFCCKTYALGCPTHDPAVEEPVREEVHVLDVPPAPVTVVHHVHHYTTVSEPMEVEPVAAPYDCDAGQGSSEGSRQVCLDFLRVLQEWVP